MEPISLYFMIMKSADVAMQKADPHDIIILEGPLETPRVAPRPRTSTLSPKNRQEIPSLLWVEVSCEPARLCKELLRTVHVVYTSCKHFSPVHQLECSLRRSFGVWRILFSASATLFDSAWCDWEVLQRNPPHGISYTVCRIPFVRYRGLENSWTINIHDRSTVAIQAESISECIHASIDEVPYLFDSGSLFSRAKAQVIL